MSAGFSFRGDGKSLEHKLISNWLYGILFLAF